jgi:hypothetical protein
MLDWISEVTYLFRMNKRTIATSQEILDQYLILTQANYPRRTL